jgi:hypothetical protein
MSGPSPLAGVAHVDYQGRRYVLGRTPDRYALWDGSVGGPPLEHFSLSTEGWAQAWDRFLRLEQSASEDAGKGGVPSPLTVGQILGGAFRLWGRHFWPLTGMAALVIVPVQAAVVGLSLSTVRFAFPPGAAPEADVPVWVDLVTNIVAAVAYTFVGAAIVRAGILALQARRPSVGDSYRAVGGRAGTLIVVAIVGALAVAAPVLPGAFVLGASQADPLSGLAGVGALLLLAGIVPAVFLAMRLLLSSGVAVVEELRGVAPLARSWSLVRGLFWRTLGAMLLAGLLIFGAALVLFAVVFAAVAASSGELTESLLRSIVLWTGIISAILLSLMLPFANLVIALLYVDSRVRKERLDIATLGQETGG